MALHLRHVQIDVPDERYADAVAFWTAALGASGTRAGVGPYTHLVGPRALLGVHLQRLDEGVARVHLDLEADDVEAEVGRLVEAGATPVGSGECEVLAGPGGLLLCVCPAPPGDELVVEPEALHARLHVLVLDVASEHVEATARFWGQAFGVEAEHLPPPYDPYWRLEGVPAPGGPMRVLVQDIGPGATPRIHLDLHVPDTDVRDAEVARLRGLGAEVIGGDRLPWTVLRDPIGTVFCVVPDTV